MQVKKANTKQEVLSDIAALEELAVTETDKEKLNRLKNTALNGVSLNTWLRRVFFGFSLTDAIERWLSAFNPSLGKPLGEQIPKEETSDVVTAWMRFLVYRGLLLLLLSSAITLVTAVFLYKQIQKQDELIAIQAQSEDQKNTFLYLQSLYDETCVEQKVEASDDSKDSDTQKVCTPTHNTRQRAEALKGYIQLRGEGADLSKAHLENISFREFNFNKAILRGAYLRGTDLRGVDLQGVDLQGAKLQETNLSGANLRDANLFGVDLQGAYLRGTDVRKTNLRKAKGLTCKMLMFASYWDSAYRDEKMACG